MSDVYAFRPAPAYRGATRAELIGAALDQPLSVWSTFWDQAKGGVLESFGIGTALRRRSLPEEGPAAPGLVFDDGRVLPDAASVRGLAGIQGKRFREEAPQELSARREAAGSLDEEQYKNSPFFRAEIPWDAGMTEDRAAALAIMYDARKMREFYAQKRPITAFLGSLAGQAVDPINYIPVVGPGVRASSIAAKAGRAAVDAAANTAVFGLATQEARRELGDDVSWQTTVSQVAMSAMIGAAFGTAVGVVGRQLDARRLRAEQERLSTIANIQQARVALNEAIGSVARGEEIRLSPNAQSGIRQVARSSGRDTGITPATFKSQPFETLDDLYAVAPQRQSALDEYARSISEQLGVEYRTPGIKARASAEEKIYRKGYANPAGLTDVVRGGFVVTDPLKADEIINRMADRFDVLDEGWNRTPDGYVDRKALVRFEDGTVAEIQVWEPKLLAAKEARGHALYSKARSLPYDSPEARALREEMQELYSAASRDAGPGWSSIGGFSGPKLLKRSRQDASSMTPAVLNTSQASTSTQSELGLSMARATDSPSTAGRSSQLTNFMADISGPSRLSDNSTAAPESLPDGLSVAAAKVGKPDSLRELAEVHGVDLTTGDFVEMADIEQMRALGRLTPEDEAAMDSADELVESAEAYGNTMKAALFCVT